MKCNKLTLFLIILITSAANATEGVEYHERFYNERIGDYELCNAHEFTLAVLRDAKLFIDGGIEGNERWYALSEATDSYEMHEIASSSAAEGFHFRQVFNNLESAESSSAASVVLEESIPCGLVKIRFTKLSGKSIIGIVGIGVEEDTEGDFVCEEGESHETCPLDCAPEEEIVMKQEEEEEGIDATVLSGVVILVLLLVITFAVLGKDKKKKGKRSSSKFHP